MIDHLHVELFGRPAGTLSIAGELRSPEDWAFQYHRSLLESDRPVALSVSLPLQPEPFTGARVRNWFCNLLPEGAVREAVTTRLRLADRDDFALLAAIGGECAGAVAVFPSEPPRATPEDGETDLDTLLYLQGDDAGEGAWALIGTPMRLSLAGAQDKIAVVREADGRLRLPQAYESSTHILKPDSRRYRGLRDLEALGLRLARAVGLNAANATPLEVSGRPALLIERFDRATDDEGNAHRLHQEDMCQALGYPGELKYQSQGGPSLAQCAALLRRLALGPTTVQGFLDWVVFNALIGNADAHAKNLALLCDRGGRRRLAPLYDLVPTLVLPESLVDRTPALRIGAAEKVDSIIPDDWRAFARETGYAPRYVLNRVAELAEAVLVHLAGATQTLVSHGCDTVRLDRAAECIATNARHHLKPTQSSGS